MATTPVYRGLRPTFPDRSRWTLPHVLSERARTHADKVFLEIPALAERYTFKETFDTAQRIAGGLAAAGCEFGDRILVMAPNSAEYVLTWFGANLAGMVEVPINNAYRGTFLEHQVHLTKPSAAVIHPEFAERFVESRRHCSSIRTYFLLGEPAAQRQAASLLEAHGLHARTFGSLLQSAPLSPLPSVRPRDLANVFFTSGTTGPSKGVMMPFGQVYFFADECVSLTRLTDQDTYMGVGPLFHGNTTFLAAYPALIAGARFVLYEKFSASNWSRWIREQGVTVTNSIGVMMDFIWKQPERPDDADNQLRVVFAAPTASGILEPFKKRFGVEAFVEVFGLTETSMPVMTPYGEPRPPGACGRLVADYFDVRLVDPETDEEVSIGEVGELIVRSRLPWTSCLGYYGMPEKTSEAFRNLWFHTGDGMRVDAEGWYYFVDRLKDALRRRGENISSYEIEQAVLRHPEIGEAAIVGVPSEVEAGEEEVMLFAVRDAKSGLNAEELWRWCETNVPAFAIPRFVAFVDSLPKTPSEKILKSELRALATRVERADRATCPGAPARRVR